MGADKEAIAAYETFLWLAGMFSFFWLAGTTNAMLSLHKQHDEKAVFSGAAILLIWQAVFAVQAVALFQHFYGGNAIITAMTVGYILFNSATFLNEYIYYLKGRSNALMCYGLATLIGQILFVLIPFYITNNILWSVGGMAVFAVLKLVLLFVNLSRLGGLHFDKSVIANLIRVSLPLSLSVLVSGSAEYIDGFLVKRFFSDELFAVFRYGSRELPFATILSNTLSTAMIASIAADTHLGLQELKHRSRKLSLWLFPVAIVLMFASKPLFVLLYSDDFLFSASIFNVLLLLLIPRLLFPQTVFNGLQQNKVLLLSSLIEIGLNITFSILFASRFGLIGIAYGTLLAFTFDKLFLVLMLRHRANIPLSAYSDLKTFSIGSVALMLAYLFSILVL